MQAAISALLLASSSLACGANHPSLGRRNAGGPMIHDLHELKRQAAPSNVASGAASTNVTYECTDYGYPPFYSVIPTYPAVWTTATIQPNDTEAMAIFQTINATVNAKLPSDLPHGTPQGNWTGVNYNYTDPDCWWTWHQCDTPAASTGLPADITMVPEPQTWGLAFDDGPNCGHNLLYDYLEENNQKATMFYIGSNVMDWPLQALRGIDDGHQICVHTWSHQYMTAFSNEEAFAELYYTRKLIKELLGVTPLYWRPPYGDVDNRIRMIAQLLNLTTIVWSYDTNDWREGANDGVTAQDVTNNYMDVIDGGLNGTYATHGPVVLNHELTNFTMGEFIEMYPCIKGAFDHVVPLCAAFNWTHPYVETNVTCPTFAEYTNGSSSPQPSSTGTFTCTAYAAASSGADGNTGPDGSIAAAAGSSPSQTATAVSTKSGAGWQKTVPVFGAAALPVICLFLSYSIGFVV